MLPLLLIAPAAASAQQQPAEPGETIIVTGTTLEESERALRECLARKCPPKEDIDATLAHAENLFVAGDYKEARRVARRSIGRNGRHAKALPIDVSDLYRAHSRISAHLGEKEDYVRSTYATRRTLERGLPADDPRVLGADFEVAGMYAATHELDRARQVYRDIEEEANELGRPDLAGLARVRAAWLSEIGGNRPYARHKLREIAEDPDPAARVARLTARVLLARLDRQEGKRDSSDTLVEELRGVGGSRPVLLHAPRIDLGSRPMNEGGSVTRRMAMDNFDDRWIDVGFWITPEGRVTDLEVLRESGPTHWAKPVLRSIEGRTYAPLDDPQGSYRVERYTYTSLWTTLTGTRMRVRSPDARIEYLDLTAEPAADGGVTSKGDPPRRSPQEGARAAVAPFQPFLPYELMGERLGFLAGQNSTNSTGGGVGIALHVAPPANFTTAPPLPVTWSAQRSASLRRCSRKSVRR
ncbi:MAG: hypothetical protein ACK40O_03935 [Allosphingosinicella sp.]